MPLDISHMKSCKGFREFNRKTSMKTSSLDPLFLEGICDLDFFEEVVRLFYANICISNGSGELETLVLSNCIIVNDLLFDDVFGTKFSGVIPYMIGVWPDDFEMSLKGAKIAVDEHGAHLSYFGPLSLCFEHRILAHIIATIILPGKISK
uniref:Uncharacterized protein n=1 Tax=Solanum tuberosum TaxID=4113 RepID=M1DN64_SOLTU